MSPFHHQATCSRQFICWLLSNSQQIVFPLMVYHTVVTRVHGGDSVLVQMAWVEKPKTCGSSSSQTTSLTLVKNLQKDYKVRKCKCVSQVVVLILLWIHFFLLYRKGERKLGGWDDNRIQYHALPFTSQHHWAVSSSWAIQVDEYNDSNLVLRCYVDVLIRTDFRINCRTNW